MVAKEKEFMMFEDGPFKMLPGHIGGLGWKQVPEILAQYNTLLQRLHGESMTACDIMSLYRILDSSSEHLFFVVADGKLVSTLHMSLALVHPVSSLLINNVVTLPNYEGQGYGKLLMNYATERLRGWYATKSIKVRLMLTNAPKKGNAGFYEKLGFLARTKESGRETVVWVKDL
jgi:GNAT superfamily N-acetyltransferase